MKRYLLLVVIVVLFALAACSSGAGKESGLIPPVVSDESLAGAAGQSQSQGGGGGGSQPTAVPTQSTTCTADDTNTAAFAAEVIRLVNIQRVNNGIWELTMNQELTNAAQAHSNDLGCNFRMSHDSLDGTTYDQRIFSFGYAGSFVGENVAGPYATPADVVDAWMNSQAHRDAILNPWFFEVGVGYVYNPNDTVLHFYHYWTMDFGG